MAEEQRRLAAIMLTDIVGYTSLAQRDETLALELLEDHNHLLRPCLSQHGGEEIKSMGDGFLVEFPSALQATRCAIEIQRALNERNATVSPDRMIQIRVGLHVGDVVHREGDVFGDGVNITSRIEPLAEPGGICLSQQVYDQVWNKIEAPLISLGQQELKHVQLSMEVYRVVLPWERRPAEVLPPLDKRRIAVLPLVNISPDRRDEYFADGMTEEIIYTLSKIRRLKVIAQTSVMTYKGQRKKIAEIGQELKVGTVLEGSVRKSDSKLRITVQLVDVQGEEHLWSEAYDRDLEDVFAIQSDIAEEVAQALQVQLLAGEKREIEKEPTENLDAYNLYLKGRYFWNKRTADGLQKAIGHFEQAIVEDPAYAMAYVGLADSYALLPDYASCPPNVAYPKARQAALKALEIDDELPEAHATLGLIAVTHDWDWQTAEREFTLAIELNPGYATAHHWYAMYLTYRRRFEEAIREMRQARDLDPLSLVINRNLGQVFFFARLYDQAIEALQKTIEMDPTYSGVHAFLGATHLQRGEYKDALVELQQEKELQHGWDPFVESGIPFALEQLGKQGAVQEAVDQMIERAKRQYVPPSTIALGYFALNDPDRGFEWLEKAREVRDRWLVESLMLPILDEYNQDPRYIALLRRIGAED